MADSGRHGVRGLGNLEKFPDQRVCKGGWNVKRKTGRVDTTEQFQDTRRILVAIAQCLANT
jgi:hypothetical protein